MFLEPKWPICWQIWPIKWKVNPSKRRSFGFYIYHIISYIQLNMRVTIQPWGSFHSRVRMSMDGWNWTVGVWVRCSCRSYWQGDPTRWEWRWMLWAKVAFIHVHFGLHFILVVVVVVAVVVHAQRAFIFKLCSTWLKYPSSIMETENGPINKEQVPLPQWFEETQGNFTI